ncbi:hypothetical protein [Jiangella asiatica]|nr:hypothetical protein [Jiangella asiatica]
MDHRWRRGDWLVLAVLLILLMAVVAAGWDEPPTSWLDRDFR